MKIKTILIDDEHLARIGMRHLLGEYAKDVEVIGECESAEEGIALVKELSPDLLFLDIEMSSDDGFDLLDGLDGREVEVIFVTAHSEFALRAFKYEATDYLLKPVDPEDLILALDKVRNKILKKRAVHPADETVEYLSSQYAKITIPQTDGFKFINVSDVIRMEADGSYVTIFTTNDRPFLVSKPLGYFAKNLNKKMFARVHRSHLINLHMVQEFRKEGGGYVVLNNGDKIQVSSTKRRAFLSEFK
ncbi:MAG: LytTR family DNA-binding domain-containing protein [Vicingaceae bacterium]